MNVNRLCKHLSHLNPNTESRLGLVLKKPLHSSVGHFATPLPFPSAAGPPPKPPIPDASFPDDRVARKRKQAELLHSSQVIRDNAIRSATVPQKRFWKTVSVNEVEHGLQIMLDNRPVRTSSRQILTLPKNKRHLATAIALEWDLLVSGQQATKQHYVPLTSICSRALDLRLADAEKNTQPRDALVKMVMGYLNTDTLLCWVPESNLQGVGFEQRSDDTHTLRDLQKQVAQPIIGFLASQVWPGVDIRPVLEADSIIPHPQPVVTAQVIEGWVSGLSAFELAGLERAVLATKSLLVATRLLVDWSQESMHRGGRYAVGGERFTIEDAAEACSLEVIWQTRVWGEVEDSHDVNKEDLRRQLGSVVVLVHGD